MAQTVNVLGHSHDGFPIHLGHVPGKTGWDYIGDDISTNTARPKVQDILNESAGGNGKGIAGALGPDTNIWSPPKTGETGEDTGRQIALPVWLVHHAVF